MIRRSVVLAGVLAFVTACGSGPPAPDDALLLARFRAEEASFEALSRNPDDEALRARLGVIFVSRSGPEELRFAAWHQKFVGVGGRVKGFLKGRVPPDKVVPDIDALTRSEPADIELYRAIKGGWYLYYSATN